MGTASSGIAISLLMGSLALLTFQTFQIQGLSTELRADFSEVRGELRGELGEIKSLLVQHSNNIANLDAQVSALREERKR